MKKTVSMVLAVVLALTLSLQALAAPSIVGPVDYDKVFSDQGSVTWKDAIRDHYSKDILDIMDYINSLTENLSVEDVMGKFIDVSKIKVFDEKSVFVSDGHKDLKYMHFLSEMKELTFYDVEPSEENPVKVTFTANNMTDTMEVYVLYYCPEHGWELLKTERTADNQVTAAFHAGTSLAALVYLDKGAQADNAEGTSPKTGEGNLTMVLALAAVAFAGVGCFALYKRRKTA